MILLALSLELTDIFNRRIFLNRFPVRFKLRASSWLFSFAWRESQLKKIKIKMFFILQAIYLWSKFQCHTFFPSQDIKQNVLLSSYLDN